MTGLLGAPPTAATDPGDVPAVMPGPPARKVLRMTRGRRRAGCGRAARRATLAALALLPALLVSGPPVPAAPAVTPLMGAARVDAGEIVAWFRLRSPGGYRASVPVEQLVAHFLDEGQAQGVAGDIAFAQSVLETGWFRFASGSVQPSDNNFSGLGATGQPGQVARFPTAQIGVRAQIQHLWAYGDPDARADATARPLVDPRFDLVSPKGKAPTWEQMGAGNWASDPDYGRKVLALYTDLLDVSHVRVERWVTAAYDDVLHRPPSGGDLAGWVPAAERRGRLWVSRTLAASTEGVSVWIRGRYVQLLGREPGAAPLAQRTATVRGGGSLADVVVALAGSDEAWRRAGGTDEAWVDQLYRSVLGRPADPAAVEHWVGALAAGTTDRGRVVRSVWGSAESRRARVVELYLDLLDRPADAAGRAWYADRLTRIDDLDVTAELVASAEHFTAAQT